jgi:hypothetical protein
MQNLLGNINWDALKSKLILQIGTIFVFAIIYQYLSDMDKEHFTVKFIENDSLYFSAVCQSTAGFGDMAPKSKLARYIVTFHLILVITILLA